MGGDTSPCEFGSTGGTGHVFREEVHSYPRHFPGVTISTITIHDFKSSVLAKPIASLHVTAVVPQTKYNLHGWSICFPYTLGCGAYRPSNLRGELKIYGILICFSYIFGWGLNVSKP